MVLYDIPSQSRFQIMFMQMVFDVYLLLYAYSNLALHL